MKKNKTRIIVLLIMFVLLCGFPICFTYFYPNKFIDGEINLGATIYHDGGGSGCGVAYCTKYRSKTCTCIACDSNHTLRNGKCESKTCSPGQYLSSGQCKSCPAGSECSGKSQPIKCSENMYSTGGQKDCSQCRGITNSSRTKCYSSCSAIGYADDCRNAGCYWDYAGTGQCVNAPVECPAGQYSNNGTCVSCPNGTYSTGGNVINCMTCRGILDANKTSCSTCGKGYYAASPTDKARADLNKKNCEDKDCKCIKCAGASIVDNRTGYETCSNFLINFPGKISPEDTDPNTGGSAAPSLVIDTDHPDYYWEVRNDGAVKSSGTGSGKTSKTIQGTYKPCSSVTVVVSVAGEVVKTASSQVSSNWSANKIRHTFEANETIPSSKKKANDAGSSYYGPSDCYSVGTNRKSCMVFARTCGAGGGGEQFYNYCCVNNGLVETSTDVVYMENATEKRCPDNYTLLENVSKNACATSKEVLGSCDISNITSSSQKLISNTCENTINMTVDEGKKCTNTVNNVKNSFYEITCAKNVKTVFDYGNDSNYNTSRTIYKGEGFGFGINIDTTINCKYTFYDAVWKTAYDNIMNKVKRINSNLVRYIEINDKTGWENYIKNNILNKNGVRDASELYRLWNLIVELRNVVDSYNKYQPSAEYKEHGKITVKTKENGKDVTKTYELLQVVKEAGTTRISNAVTKSLNTPLVNNPRSYTLSSSSPRRVSLIPKRTCINRSTGEIKIVDGNNKCPDNSVDGGNKVYIGYDTDVTKGDSTYGITIEVDGLGTNNSAIKNDKCNIKVLDNEFVYRAIDVTNPFINSTREKGENWSNAEYDFTQTIDSNTWNTGTYNRIVLTSKDIEAIKKSNASNRNSSPYMGLCNSLDKSVQDEITRKICNAIK